MKKTLILFLLFVSTLSYSQPKSGVIAHNHLGFQVADLQKSTKFYGEILGLERIEVPDNLKAIRAWFKIGDVNQIHLLAGRTQPVVNDRNGSHTALFVDDIAKAEAYLKQNNIEYHRQVRFDGVVQIFFSDPDGYVLEYNEKPKTGIDAKNIEKHISYLASDELKGRGTGTKDEIKAANYIAEQFKNLNLQPKGTDGYLQKFKASIDTVHVVDAYNVAGFLDNGAENTIVIGAHYDHLGEGYQRGSLEPDSKGKIHNGADDNASGVAGVLEMARYLSTNAVKEKHNFLFLAFSGEELGLLGSKYYANNPTIDLAKMNFMVNFDMIGRYDANKGITIGGWGTSSRWGQTIPALADQAKVRYKIDSAGAGPSDHTSFYTKNRPVLFFFTGVHTDYHKPSDDTQLINFAGEAVVLKLFSEILADVDKNPTFLDFKETAMPMARNMKFKVTLGLMPDYSFNGPGLKIDGVSKGRPAETAGIKAGDLLLRLGNYMLNTIYDYMGALGKFEKGQTVEAEIQRGNEKIIKNVTF